MKMFDLVLFDACKNGDCGCVNARNANKGFFFSTNSVDAARAACARSRYIHLATYEADIGLVRACAQNGASMVIALSDLASLPPYEKSKLIGRMRRLARLCAHFNACIRVVTLAKNEYGLRSPDELVLLGQFFGLGERKIKSILEEGIEA
jgi:RNase P/RNase MRP subunit p30